MLTSKQQSDLNKSLKRFGFRTYSEFLKSDLWIVFSRFMHKLPQYKKCISCGSRNKINLHHVSYYSLLDPRDIEPLCRECHADEHSLPKTALVKDHEGKMVKVAIILPGSRVRKGDKRSELGMLVKKYGFFQGNRIFNENNSK